MRSKLLHLLFRHFPVSEMSWKRVGKSRKKLGVFRSVFGKLSEISPKFSRSVFYLNLAFEHGLKL